MSKRKALYNGDCQQTKTFVNIKIANSNNPEKMKKVFDRTKELLWSGSKQTKILDEKLQQRCDINNNYQPALQNKCSGIQTKIQPKEDGTLSFAIMIDNNQENEPVMQASSSAPSCSTCGASVDVVRCGWCSIQQCAICVRVCGSCLQHFCYLCCPVDYEGSQEQNVCLHCSEK